MKPSIGSFGPPTGSLDVVTKGYAEANFAASGSGGGGGIGTTAQNFNDTINLAGIESYSGSSGLVVGQVAIDPSEYDLAGSTLIPQFRVVAAVSSVDQVTGSVKLINITDSDDIHSFEITGSQVAKIFSASLVIGASAGQLDNSLKIYEVQISSSLGTETVELGSAQMVLINKID